MDKQEAIETIKKAKRNMSISGAQDELDSFENGIEYCLAVLEERKPEYKEK